MLRKQDKYLAQLERVDGALGTLLDAPSADAAVLVQSDNGDYDRSHSTDRSGSMIIPWTVAEPSVRPGYRITKTVSLLDTAPTLASVMDVTPHPDWGDIALKNTLGALASEI